MTINLTKEQEAVLIKRIGKGDKASPEEIASELIRLLREVAHIQDAARLRAQSTQNAEPVTGSDYKDSVDASEPTSSPN